jgi:hypothetical protein
MNILATKLIDDAATSRAPSALHNTMDFSTSSLVPLGWNDVISSFRSFSNCQTVLFEDINFGGSTTQKTVDLSFVGKAMNDRASSIQWF